MPGLRSSAGLSLLALAALLAACGDDSASTSATDTESTGSAGGSAGGGSPGSGGASATTTSSTGNGGAGSTSSSSSGQGGEAPCAAGTIICEAAKKRVCDGEGGFTDEEVCDPGVCIAGFGCTLCAPGSGVCDGEESTVCNDDGMGFTTYTCDPVQGVTCDQATGHCQGACAPEELGASYIGCDYYAVQTVNGVDATFNFAVAIANTSDAAASIHIQRGDTVILEDSVPADSVRTFTLPWIDALKLATASALTTDGAYRIRTDNPVTVYQYNPIEYENGGFDFSVTNDASLLLPANAWTGTYRVVSRNHFNYDDGFTTASLPGFYAVVATHDATTVNVTPSASGAFIVAGGGLPANGAGTVTLNDGDVLQVLTSSSNGYPDFHDLTGTLIEADKPVQVLGGHECTFIPFDIWACDHLEEVMFPEETLSTRYIVTPPLIPTGGITPKAQMVRIVATQASTTLTYDPAQPSAPTFIANPGDYVEIAESLADFLISADKPISVSQYMLGQEYGGGSGDPAMALAVAVDQYRDEYLLHAPTNYEASYLNVTAPVGATITLDGGNLPPVTPIGATGFGVARVTLSNGGDGNHFITGNEPFGISVYGYGQYTSYWYPGGLNLEKLSTD